ncbi:MAG: hypothetical protein WCO57_16985, partial [Verrucomicrobiota bacterium]
MKPSLVTPVLAIFVGFGLGWLLKPAASPAPGPVAPATATKKTTPPGSPTAASQRDPTDPRIPAGPVGHVAPVQPITDVVERGRRLEEAKAAAKMQRFAEAIGLTVVQQAELKKVITENEKVFVANGTGGAKETLDSLVNGGSALEKALAALLTPEQTTAFAELRKRENDNRIEATAQRNLGNLTEITDLSAEQRDKTLEVLRQATVAEIAAMPSCLSLILDSSILPLGSQAASEQSIQTLRQIAETPDLSDPRAQHAKLIENQRRKLDARVNLLKAILTPGQLAQYQATL